MKTVIGVILVVILSMDRASSNIPVSTVMNCTQNGSVNAIEVAHDQVLRQTSTPGQAFFFPASESPLQKQPISDPQPPFANTSSLHYCPYALDMLKLPAGYIPETIHQARCLCHFCIHADGNQCRRVSTGISLWRPTGCYKGQQLYELEVRRVPRSCRCVYSARPEASTQKLLVSKDIIIIAVICIVAVTLCVLAIFFGIYCRELGKVKAQTLALNSRPGITEPTPPGTPTDTVSEDPSTQRAELALEQHVDANLKVTTLNMSVSDSSISAHL